MNGLHKRQNMTRKVPEKRKFLGIYFKCCHVYSRIYRNKAGDKYIGFCPKCAKRVEVKIGSGGTSERFFAAE